MNAQSNEFVNEQFQIDIQLHTDIFSLGSRAAAFESQCGSICEKDMPFSCLRLLLNVIVFPLKGCFKYAR